MTQPSLPKILCVDDDWNLLSSLNRVLRAQFNVKITHHASNAIDILEKDPDFAVVMSDLRMPGIQGLAFLERVKKLAPDAVRVLFTGQAEVKDAVAAINDGLVFRFVLKPCPSLLLVKTLLSAVEQHRLVTAERTLLQQTLRECVNALVEVLSAAQPAAFGQALRLKKYAVEMAEIADPAERWQVEVAALLSQLGAVTLGAETLERVRNGEQLSPDEQALVDAAPAVAVKLVGNIPRLEAVREILAHIQARYDGSGTIRFNVAGDRIPLGARILKLASDFETLLARGRSVEDAIEGLRSQRAWYDPTLLETFIARQSGNAQAGEIAELPLNEVQPGMVFVDDVVASNGLLLATRQQEVTDSLIERIRTFWRNVAGGITVRVLLPKQAAPALAGARA
jgi:response regulator RpfG family c-di-GMP phosphodiesterase